jgi:hypothetical protein
MSWATAALLMFMPGTCVTAVLVSRRDAAGAGIGAPGNRRQADLDEEERRDGLK